MDVQEFFLELLEVDILWPRWEILLTCVAFVEGLRKDQDRSTGKLLADTRAPSSLRRACPRCEKTRTVQFGEWLATTRILELRAYSWHLAEEQSAGQAEATARSGRGSNTVYVALQHMKNHVWSALWPAMPADARQYWHWVTRRLLGILEGGGSDVRQVAEKAARAQPLLPLPPPSQSRSASPRPLCEFGSCQCTRLTDASSEVGLCLITAVLEKTARNPATHAGEAVFLFFFGVLWAPYHIAPPPTGSRAGARRGRLGARTARKVRTSTGVLPPGRLKGQGCRAAVLASQCAHRLLWLLRRRPLRWPLLVRRLAGGTAAGGRCTRAFPRGRRRAARAQLCAGTRHASSLSRGEQAVQRAKRARSRTFKAGSGHCKGIPLRIPSVPPS